MKSFQVTVTIDRPIGYVDDYGNCYPINYGYVAGVIGGDGEEQDAYVLTDRKEPLTTFTGQVIAKIIRQDDVEEKWIVAKDARYTKDAIYQATKFIEQYFDSHVELLNEEK